MYFAAVFLGLLPSLAATTSSAKRGLIDVATANSERDSSYFTSPSDLTWYYNYAATPSSLYTSVRSLQFVPQLWGLHTTSSFTDTVRSLIASGTNVPYVLTFNEPDGPASTGGSSISPADAAAAWISQVEPLRTDGVMLGAPAVTGSPRGFVWLQDFFTACAGKCTADFIPVHWYGNFEGLASHIGQVRGNYQNKTIWVTEYALDHQSLKASQEFYRLSAEFFDRIDYITHYSYFGAFRSSVSNVGPNAAMLTEKGTLTDIGAWYLGRAAEGNIPSASQGRTIGVVGGWVIVVLAVIAVANSRVW